MALLAKGLTVREAAMRLKIGKTALYAALNPEPSPAGGSKRRSSCFVQSSVQKITNLEMTSEW
jgi:hypothetical protein